MQRLKIHSSILLVALALFSCTPSTDNKPEPAVFWRSSSFVYQGTKYRSNYDIQVATDDIGPLFGYLINKRDLEHWQTYDNDPSIHYLIDEGNNNYRRNWPDDSLIDRYEVFEILDSNCFAVKDPPLYIVYLPIEAEK